MRLKLSIGDKRYETEIDFEPDKKYEDKETSLYELREKAGGFIANTVRLHYGIGVMKELEVGEMVEVTKLTDKDRTFIPVSPAFNPPQWIHKYANGQALVGGKPIDLGVYTSMVNMGARVHNHAHNPGEPCPDAFNMSTPATYGETK